jgi:HK97 family phage portal protein
MAGVAHGHDVAVLDGATKFIPLTMPPDEAQFLQSRRWQVVDIARFYGVPPWLLGDVEKSTSWGTGIEQQNLGFVSYTINFWTTRIEQRITWEIATPTDQTAEFEFDALLRGDMAERYAAYATAIQWGWLTRNEARKKENLPPIKGLDEPLQPMMMPPTSVGGEQDVPGAGQSNPTDTFDPSDDDSNDDDSSS